MHYLVEEIVNWSMVNQSCGHWLLGGFGSLEMHGIGFAFPYFDMSRTP